MAGYAPLKITGMQTGLVQEREEFILPDDAYPVLQNAYVWREKILRKKGYQLLGRLQRSVNSIGINTLNLLSGLESTATLVPGSINIIGVGGQVFTDPNADGILQGSLGGSGIVNYATGAFTGPGLPLSGGTFQYYPGLPVMGLRTQELPSSVNDQMVAFDQKYAYIYDSSILAFKEFIPGTTWNASGEGVDSTSFFWSTNYWNSGADTPFLTPGNKLFWVTNNTGAQASPDPIRITDGTTWLDFVPPTYGQIDATNFLVQCLAFLPFRGRMVAFNTYEGPALAGALHFSNRIRWSTIGNPFIAFSNVSPAKGSWRDDIRGQGGYLDIPTSEDIVSVGFVRDNLVIYCERSTWQLRYTGRSIAPFQIEKVNSELGAQSLFSAVQFDTSLVGIGDKGIVECDSYKSEKIDVKIPDLVWRFENDNNGVARVHGIRDLQNRLAYWTISINSEYDSEITRIFPNQRLVYNYENDSWALFNDSLTTLGNFQYQSAATWLNTDLTWLQANFSWIDQPPQTAVIIGGNQQGFVQQLNKATVNGVSLFISDITGGQPVVITSPNHNMKTGFVIEISAIPTGTPFDSLNGGVFGVVVLDSNRFELWLYNSDDDEFSEALGITSVDPYIGGGLITIRENFSIRSKKFNFLDEGQSIQLGYIDILMQSTGRDKPGAISLNVYLDYNDEEASNTLPQNEINDGVPVSNPDTFFNSVIPTTPSTLNSIGGTKFWQRVICPTRANFLTLEYTLSNSQMAGQEQNKEVQIDAQVLWVRKSGRLSQI
jgi:hypothetical protein